MSAFPAPVRILVLLAAGMLAARADTDRRLAFTSFAGADLTPLASGQVLQARGGLIDFQRGIVTQSLYIIDAAPAVVQDRLAHLNPAAHPELKVWLHQPLPPKPVVGDFAALNGLPNNSSVNNMVSATYGYTPGGSLQVNAAEGQLLAAGHGQEPTKDFVVATWSQILSGRMDTYLRNDLKNSVYQVSGGDIAPLQEIRSLLRSDPQVYRAFQATLSGTPVEGANRKAPTGLYFECFDIEGTAAFGTGALYQAASPETIQQADIEFYDNSGIYCSVELEQLWPIEVNGKTETLVWRDDLVSTSNIAYLHGTERLASGMIMLQDVKQAIDAFRAEFKP